MTNDDGKIEVEVKGRIPPLLFLIQPQKGKKISTSPKMVRIDAKVLDPEIYILKDTNPNYEGAEDLMRVIVVPSPYLPKPPRFSSKHLSTITKCITLHTITVCFSAILEG